MLEVTTYRVCDGVNYESFCRIGIVNVIKSVTIKSFFRPEYLLLHRREWNST